MFIDYGTREASPDNWKIWIIQVQIIEIWLYPFKFLGAAFNSIQLGLVRVECFAQEHNITTRPNLKSKSLNAELSVKALLGQFLSPAD